jgi:uncharacterized protein (DUF58 family)
LVREYEDEHARCIVIAVDHALPAAVRAAVAAAPGGLTPAEDAEVVAVERAISVAASLADVYLELGWTVELVARGSHVPAGSGRGHAARIARALAMLPYAGDETAFAPLPARMESMLVIPRGTLRGGRPATTAVMDA